MAGYNNNTIWLSFSTEKNQNIVFLQIVTIIYFFSKLIELQWPSKGFHDGSVRESKSKSKSIVEHIRDRNFHFSTRSRFEVLSSFLLNIRSVSLLNWHKAATCCNENVGYSDTGIWLWSGINQNCLVSTVLDTLARSTHGHGVVGQALVLVGAEALGDHLRQVSWFVELHTVELARKAFGCGFLSTLFHHRAAANVGRIWVPWIGSDWIGRNWIDEEKHHRRQNGLKQKLIH